MDEVAEHDAKMKFAGDEFVKAEQEYNEVNRLYNENNLQLTRQQSKVNALQAGT